MKSTFSEWSLDKIDATFDVHMVRTLPSLNAILTHKETIDEFTKRQLVKLSEKYFLLGGEDWNEAELESKMIAPLFGVADIDNSKFSYFIERVLSAKVGDYELVGKVDGMVATGFRNPRKPYFCLNEYKRATDPDGDPKGQALIAMLTAQQINDNGKPILGCYVVGRQWCFIALEGNEYAFSTAFTCDNDDIFDIHRILCGLRIFIDKII
jgi:hypothetical protein